MNFLVSLQESGLFPDGIEVAFLPVGHTHNEVDQVASRISIGLRKRDIKTPPELFRYLRESFDDLDVVLVNKVANTKEYINPRQKKNWTWSRFKHIQNL